LGRRRPTLRRTVAGIPQHTRASGDASIGDDDRPRVWVAALALFVALVVIWRLTRRIQPWDALVLLRAGHDVVRGVSPYPHLHSSTVYGGHAFVYPYVSAWVMGPLGALPAHAGQLAYLALSTAALVAAWWLSATRSSVVLLCMLLSSTTIIALQIGSIEPLLLLGIVAAWRWRDRAVVCGLCLAAVMVAKVFLLPLIAWLVLARRWRAAGVAAGATAVLLLGGWLLGPIGAPDYFRMLGSLSAHESLQGWSLIGYLLHHGVARSSANHVAIAAAAAAIGIGWLTQLRTRSDAALIIACLGAALLASPVVWAHYFVLLWLLPLLTRLPRVTSILLAISTWLVIVPHKVVVHPLTTWLTGTQRAFLMQTLIVVTVLAAAAIPLVTQWRAARKGVVRDRSLIPERRPADEAPASDEGEFEGGLAAPAGEAKPGALGVRERHRELQPIPVPITWRRRHERVEITIDPGPLVLDRDHHTPATARAHDDRHRAGAVHESVVEQHVKDL
jgi:hypothetical protein